MNDTRASEPARSVPSSGGLSWKILLIGTLLLLPFVWVFVRGFSLDPRRMDAPLVGKPAPAFALKRLADDHPVTSADLRGKPLVLNFWATWCIPCRDEHPVLVQGAKHYGERFHFVGVVYQDRKESVTQWLERYGGHAYPTLIDIDGKVAIAYGVYGVPETYFIDAEGIVRSKYVGPMNPMILAMHLKGLEKP